MVLIALSATNITMLLALVFVLARNVIKSLMDGRRGLPFGRFRAKLVLAMLGMTVIPSVLVMIVGSRVVLTAVDRWFNAPMEQILAGANSIAGDYYEERQRLVSEQAARIARSLSGIDLSAAELTRVQRIVTPEVTGPRVGMVQVYRAVREPDQPVSVLSVMDIASPSMPPSLSRSSTDLLAARAASGDDAAPSRVDRARGRRRSRARRHRRCAMRSGQITGVVVTSEYLSGEFADQGAAHVEGVRGLLAAAGAEATAGRRLRVVLRDGHAADSRRLDLDGPVSGEAHHAAGAVAVGSGEGNWRRALRPSHRARGQR